MEIEKWLSVTEVVYVEEIPQFLTATNFGVLKIPKAVLVVRTTVEEI